MPLRVALCKRRPLAKLSFVLCVTWRADRGMMKVRHEGRETHCRCACLGEANGRKPPWGKSRGERSGAEHPDSLGVALPAWIRRGAVVTRLSVLTEFLFPSAAFPTDKAFGVFLAAGSSPHHDLRGT